MHRASGHDHFALARTVNPPIRLSRVVLPLPDFPTRATNSPADFQVDIPQRRIEARRGGIALSDLAQCD